MADPDIYLGPSDPDEITDDDVHIALAFLIAIEPTDGDEIDSPEQYEAALESFRNETAAAMCTLRRFAEQAQPQTIDQMRAAYYGFTNDPRYLGTAEISGVVTSALSEAWDGVGLWRR